MPFVEVSPDIILYYEILCCEDSSTDVQKPWLLLVHQLLMDSCYMKPFSNDPVLRKNFNQVFFDLRHHGRSHPPAMASVDLYTLAADLAFGLEKLNIPPVHALGTHSWASEILLRMAALFPTQIISLCLSSIPPSEDTPFLKRAFFEAFQSCANPESVDEWDEAVASVQWFNFGNPRYIDVDISDEWAGVFLRRYPPCRSYECTLGILPFLQRDVMPFSLTQTIKQPVLFIRGERDEIFTHSDSQTRLNELPFHPFHDLQTISDAPLMCCRTHIEEVRSRYINWLKPILEQEIKSQTEKPMRCWKSSLEKLALHCQDDSICQRDPLDSSSYYRKSLQEILETKHLQEQQRSREPNTFSLIGGGAPEIWTGATFDEVVPWRFSSRFDNARISNLFPKNGKPLCALQIIETSIETEKDIDQIENLMHKIDFV
ncbi:hypothetical protein O181_004975 [Austropuccinia psidii MF-1]|uniref:AB hydrolase-1 domain-containing protein n=1 Tax=Austropuccinia psidii MF-1 TaxID=1389203 RepID=A0A9Q3BHH5_9BASI|nr:hypothetical protein [Austropuccinia psidii MF-1]